ncbi:MAG: plasmid pRiA4b ORF-3 family protein [Microbacteriaceae bacterium]|nr:plasmid pRiA4b ORF-3 family protein [Microbacteriaceae bacterium]
MPPPAQQASTVLRLRVAIIGSEPEIWRQLEVDADLCLTDLHDVLQIAFGWRDSHLHSFTDHDPFSPQHQLPRIGRPPRTWAPDDPYGDDEEVLPESEWTLAQVFDGFDGPLFYLYDFGDGWIHLIELVERIVEEQKAPKAVLLRGERRGPLEDSGGIAGYFEKLDILSNPQHPEHNVIAGWVRWVAGPWLPFDPGLLDIDNVNEEFGVRFDPGLGMSGLPTDAFPGHPKPAEYVASAAVAVPILPADAAVIDLLERLPVPLRGELRGLLRRSGALAPVEIDVGTATTMVEPFLWLLRRAGTGGIRLTQAGWLPPAVVSEAMLELGWADRWFGKANREDQTAPIATLRGEATRLGLLRKRNGVLHATAAARSHLEDPVGLWWMIADTFLRRTRSGPERDIASLVALDIATGHTAEDDAGFGYDMNAIRFGLEALGWSDANDGSLSTDAIVRPVYEKLNQMDPLGVFEVNRWHRSGVTDGGRAFARAMLRSPV